MTLLPHPPHHHKLGVPITAAAPPLALASLHPPGLSVKGPLTFWAHSSESPELSLILDSPSPSTLQITSPWRLSTPSASLLSSSPAPPDHSWEVVPCYEPEHGFNKKLQHIQRFSPAFHSLWFCSIRSSPPSLLGFQNSVPSLAGQGSECAPLPVLIGC